MLSRVTRDSVTVTLAGMLTEWPASHHNSAPSSIIYVLGLMCHC